MLPLLVGHKSHVFNRATLRQSKGAIDLREPRAVDKHINRDFALLKQALRFLARMPGQVVRRCVFASETTTAERVEPKFPAAALWMRPIEFHDGEKRCCHTPNLEQVQACDGGEIA
ncbi:hypothetical protein [Sphingomonas sp. Ant20]|uniref:hypothetical protein n=1 Tax=Sphingomonas sp. Ant20 TaxID=104605 RepID=UPI000FE1442C|nr:hypothetical protein [Sphingomonas sp. Ant20]